MATIIYLHGFASTGNGEKATKLKEVFGDQVLSPTIPLDTTETIEIITQLVKRATSFPIVFVGTSLGGFWANYFAHLMDAPCVLVNPAMSPSNVLKKYVGRSIQNYNVQEFIEVTPDHLEAFRKLEFEADLLFNGKLVNLFLAMDDSELEYAKTLEQLKYFNTCRVTPTGGHRYTEQWPLVIEEVRKLIS